jgi:hypothetical protein
MYSALFLAHIRPDFVALDIAAAQVSHAAVHQVVATVAHVNQETADRIPVNACHPLCAANAVSF